MVSIPPTVNPPTSVFVGSSPIAPIKQETRICGVFCCLWGEKKTAVVAVVFRTRTEDFRPSVFSKPGSRALRLGMA